MGLCQFTLLELKAAFYIHKLAMGFLSQHAPRAVCNACTHYKQLMSILQRWAKYIVWYLSLDLHIIMYSYYRNLCRIIFNCSFCIFVIGWVSWYWICEVWNFHHAGLKVVGQRNFLFLMKFFFVCLFACLFIPLITTLFSPGWFSYVLIKRFV